MDRREEDVMKVVPPTPIHLRVVQPAPPFEANPCECGELKDVEAVEQHRRVLCTHQNACVRFADAQKWRGFHCGNCAAYLPMTKDQMRADLDGLAGLLRAIS